MHVRYSAVGPSRKAFFPRSLRLFTQRGLPLVFSKHIRTERRARFPDLPAEIIPRKLAPVRASSAVERENSDANKAPSLDPFRVCFSPPNKGVRMADHKSRENSELKEGTKETQLISISPSLSTLYRPPTTLASWEESLYTDFL